MSGVEFDPILGKLRTKDSGSSGVVSSRTVTGSSGASTLISGFVG